MIVGRQPSVSITFNEAWTIDAKQPTIWDWQAFYREGLKLPRPYMAKLFRWAAFGDWWDAYALVKVPTLVIGGRVSKVPVKIAQGIHEAVPGSSFVVFEADEGGGHAMFWEGPQKYNDSLRTFMRSS